MLDDTKGGNMSFFKSLGKSISKGLSSFTKSFKSNPIGSILGMTGLPQSSSQWIPGGELLQSGFADIGDNMSELYDIYSGRDIAKKNYDLQKEQFEYQKSLNTTQMQREDTAMQRKVADLKAAGLNPVLAANGTGASSVPLHAGPAPQMADTSGAGREGLAFLSNAVMTALKMKKDFAVQDANIQKLQAERGNIIADTAKKEEETKNLRILNNYEDEYLRGRNQGQHIANEMHSFGLFVSKSKLPYDLQKWQNDLTLQDKEIALKDLEKSMNELRVTGLELDNIYKGLLNNAEYKKLSKLDQEIQLNVIAIAMKQAELDEYQYARGYFHERYGGTPVGYALPSIHMLPYNIIRNAVEEVSEWVPKPSVSIDYKGIRSYQEKNKPSIFDKKYNHTVSNWFTKGWPQWRSGDYGVRRNY